MSSIDTIDYHYSASGGDLLKYIHQNYKKGIPERQAIHIFKQILNALKYLHAMDTVHRDLKVFQIFYHLISCNLTLNWNSFRPIIYY